MKLMKENVEAFFDFDCDDELVQFERKSKGCLFGTMLKIKNGNEFRINFYDTTRFKQEVDEELFSFALLTS